MILASDRSTVMAQFKCGTKGLVDLERKLDQSEQMPINKLYGLDLIDFLENKKVTAPPKLMSGYTYRHLSKLVSTEIKKPFFIFLREPDALFRAQIIQSLRRVCRRSEIFDESITFGGSDYAKKDSMFKLIAEIYNDFLPSIYSDEHYTYHYFSEALSLIQYIEHHRKDIFDNLFLLNLDNYSKTDTSLKLLNKYNVIDFEYFKTRSWHHSTKSLYIPEIFTPSKITGIYQVPYKKNKRALELINSLYKSKIYTYERLFEYDQSTI